MGARTLKKWIEAPLRNIINIEQRQDAVEFLLKNLTMRNELIELFASIYDLERIISKLEIGSANARDLVSLRTSLKVLPRIKNILNSNSTCLLKHLSDNIDLNENILDVLTKAIVDEPPFSIREGGMIKAGYNKELDELHLIAKNNTSWMQNFEMKLKENTGIKNLKVGYNKVFGYYIEVSKGNVNLVPDYFVRKQTLVNAERYIVPELKDFENKILSAKEKIHQLEYYLFNNIREIIRNNISELQETAKSIGIIDTLLSMSILAYKNNYIRPTLNNKNEIKIIDGRHPVVENILKKEIFVPNDTLLNNNNQKTMIITGPNMSGKSTYMRQVALLVLMAQMGSFIPAKSASIYPVDKIFTRVGASDDLATGQSTFMVEMNEVANILKNATSNSLVILDEVGRGTSTYDGMSIAKAVVEYINNKIGAKTLFATHYHQLMELEDIMDGVKNFSVAVKERVGSIIFLRRIVKGGTDKSYGIHVAKLAGIPKSVLTLAEKYLIEFDSQKNSNIIEIQKGTEENSDKKSLVQEDLFTTSITKKIIDLDVLSLSPIEALNELYKLQEEAKKQGGIL
jgi:DNA mismatch repair protein MutS